MSPWLVSSRRPAVYVLRAFQKKSKTGRETPRRDLELVKQRLREAEGIAKERKP
jgi:phage-related protein